MLEIKKCDKLETIFAAPLDYMAKRKLNTAPKTKPNISLSDIESNGLTLESMKKINVPIYKYRTQITIHGLWPETEGYCFGYKHLVQNKNGSFGVRYGAIDGRKKKTIRNIARFSEFYPRNDSQGTSFVGCYKNDITRLKTDFANITKHKHLFIGSVDILHDRVFTGYYYILINLRAIPKENLWAFCETILNITKSEFKSKKIAKLAKDRAYHLKLDQERNARQVKRDRLRAEAVEALNSFGLTAFTPNGKAFRGIKPYINDDYTSPKYVICETKRKGPNMCILRAKFSDIQTALDYKFDWTKKARKYDKWQKLNKLWA